MLLKVSDEEPSSSRWPLRRESARHMPHLVRLALAAAGLAALSMGTWAVLRPHSGDLGSTALIVVGGVLVLLAVLGRFPDRLSVGDVEMEFRRDSLEEILAVVRAEAPEIFDQVVDIARGGTRTPDAVDEAARAAQEEQRQEAAFETTVMLRDSVPAAEAAENVDLGSLSGLRRDVDVAVPSRGRPPRVDATFHLDGKVVAIEIKSSWSRSTSRLVKQRLARVLTSPEYAAAVLIVPRELLTRALADIDDPRIVVATPDDVARLPQLVRTAIAESD